MMGSIIVQDDVREEHLANIFNLERSGGRIDWDAKDELENFFELKSTSKGSVSTARDLGYNHIQKWRNRYWIIADFTQHGNGNYSFDQFWFLAPYHMEMWYDEILARLNKDKKIATEAVDVLRSAGARYEVIQRVSKLCADGALLNDPNISKGYIRRHGISLLPCASRLRELVSKYPVGHKHPSDEFFTFRHPTDDLFIFK